MVEASKTAWMATADGFTKVSLVDQGPRYRKLEYLEGPAKGQTCVIPGKGIPSFGFHPALYVQKEKPDCFFYKGRSLQKVDINTFKDPVQAKALVPKAELYDFRPLTTEVMDGIIEGDHVLLPGPKGTGKTSLVCQIANRIGHPVIRLNITGFASISDFVGCMGLKDGSTVWKDGPVISAMRNGYWLLLDEFNFGDPRVMSLFHSILETNKPDEGVHPSYTLKENDGEVVVAHPNFRVFATLNNLNNDDGDYTGTEKINAALLDRFTGHGMVINVPAMSYRQELKIVSMRVPNLPRTVAKRACELAAALRNGGDKVPVLRGFSTRELLNFCSKLTLYKDAIQAAERTFLAVAKTRDVEPLKAAILAKMGRRIILGGTSLPKTPNEVVTSEEEMNPTLPVSETPTEITPQVAKRNVADVTDEAELEAIWKAYKGNGGSLSYEGIELNPSFRLKHANGKTAWDLCKKWDKNRAKTPKKEG